MSVMLALGVKVHVQVVPPSEVLKPLTWPLATVISAVVKLVTASLKVNVTKEVSPTFNAVSATTAAPVGRVVSIFTVSPLD